MSRSMKEVSPSIPGFAATVLLAVVAHPGFAAEVTHVPATALAAANADLIARADRALRDYIGACSTGDKAALARIITSDAAVEYELEDPGTFFKVEAAALIPNLSANTKPSGIGTHISDLWIFPTPDPNVVFVSYTIGSDAQSPAQGQDFGQLAIIEMRGDRIFKMRNFRKRNAAQR